MGGGNSGAAQLPPPSPPIDAGLEFFPQLTTLSLRWPHSLSEPLAPLARLMRLTALKLCGCTSGAMEADWLPPNLEELHLSAARNHLRGIGGAGWLAALHAGACPRLRALHLDDLAVRDVRPGGRWQGLTLANTLPRLTALEELVATVYGTTEEDDYEEYDSDDDSGYWKAYWAPGDEWKRALPVPAAPLLAALPNLRHCQAGFVRTWRDYVDEAGIHFYKHHCRTTPMLLLTPGELATLRAPRLEALSVGLVTSSDVDDEAWRCPNYVGSDDDDDGDDGGDANDAAQGGGAAAVAPAGAAANAPAGAAARAGAAAHAPAGALAASAGAPAAASIPIGSSLPALRSLQLFLGCPQAAGGHGSVWDLSALLPGSLPALRRLLVQPLVCACGKLPLDALARAAPGLKRLVIDPCCAGPLDALFCDGGCALSLRWVGVLPAPYYHPQAAEPARLEAELRLGLRTRKKAAAAAAAGGPRSGAAAPHLTVTLFYESQLQRGAGADRSVPMSGAAVERRALTNPDTIYADTFLIVGTRPGAFEGFEGEWDRREVRAYERKHGA